MLTVLGLLLRAALAVVTYLRWRGRLKAAEEAALRDLKGVTRDFLATMSVARQSVDHSDEAASHDPRNRDNH